MTSELIILCVAAALAGVVNAIAGGGTLLTFPALALILGPSAAAAVAANATSTVALFPGSLAAMWGYRRELSGAGPWVVAKPKPANEVGLEDPVKAHGLEQRLRGAPATAAIDHRVCAEVAEPAEFPLGSLEADVIAAAGGRRPSGGRRLALGGDRPRRSRPSGTVASCFREVGREPRLLSGVPRQPQGREDPA